MKKNMLEVRCHGKETRGEYIRSQLQCTGVKEFGMGIPSLKRLWAFTRQPTRRLHLVLCV